MQQKMEAGEPPAFITDWPEPYPDRADVWRAWHHLTASRSSGFGSVSGIPFEAIDRYADRYGIEDFEAFHRLLMAMDSEYMDYLNERRKRNG